MSDEIKFFPPPVPEVITEFLKAIDKEMDDATGASAMASNSLPLEPTSITLAGIQQLAEEMERRFPRKTTPAYFRMHPLTAMRLNAYFPPVKARSLGITTFVSFSGMPILEKDDMLEGIVEVLNTDKEVIETITVYV